MALSLGYLPKAETLCIYELPEVVMISENEYLIFTVLEVVMPSLQGLNNS